MTLRQRSTPTRPRRALLAGSVQRAVGAPPTASWAGGLHSLAQGATPAAENGVTSQVLAVAPLPAPVAAPARLVLLRLTCARGASLPAPALPGPLLGAVEAGIFAVHADHPIRVGRVGEAGAARTDATAGPGNQLRTLG